MNDTVSVDVVRWLVEITRQVIDPAIFRSKPDRVQSLESLSASHHNVKRPAIG